MYITRSVSDTIYLTSETFKVTNYAYYTDNAVTSAGQDISYRYLQVSRHTSPSLDNWLQFTFLQLTYFEVYFKSDFLRTHIFPGNFWQPGYPGLSRPNNTL